MAAGHSNILRKVNIFSLVIFRELRCYVGRAALFESVRKVVLSALNDGKEITTVEEDDEEEQGRGVSRSQSLVDMALFASYLVASHDKHYSAAFDLMHMVLVWVIRTSSRNGKVRV